ncbi:MAG: hypothetical protein AAFW89_00575 [Bacteroidota bacterium]
MEYCENSHDPDSDCDGVCHLEKQMHKTHTPSDNAFPIVLSSISELRVFIHTPSVESWTRPGGERLSRASTADFFYSNDYLKQVFHPPEYRLS